MRFLGQSMSFVKPASKWGLLLFLFTACIAAAQGQSAPYVLPYTMSTFAGPHAAYTAGAACGSFIALDAAGDGCLANAVSVGADPHDIRVDGAGNVFWIDNNGSTALIHKISAVSGRETVYVGSLIGKVCGTNADKTGDNCPATDGGANVGTTNTAGTPKSRGLGLALNGDLFFADYGGDLVHKVSITTGLQTIVSGVYVTANTTNPPISGPVGTALLNTARGVGVDSNGNVYIADTGDGNLRVVYSGVGTIPGVSSPQAGYTYNLTAYNPSTINTKAVSSGVPLSSVTLNALEDVQVDSNNNVYIADTGNGVVRVIYNGKGNIPGITNPITGYVYVVAGFNALNTSGPATATSYPKDGTAPTFPAINITISDRKIALDSRNNLYIADSNSNVVWFVDNATGNIRLLAGAYGGTAGANAPCFASGASTSTVGDGCVATLAALYSAADMGTSPDNQGNVYITDAQGGTSASARLRKVLSGLNFPSTPKGTTVVQNLYIHFGPGDTRAAANAFVLTGTASNSVDYTLGAQNCTVQTDTTQDCVIPVTFSPTKPGYDTATLTITSAAGGSNSYLITGTGVVSAIALDPGFVTVQNTAVKTPQGVAVDSVGNIYTADTANNRVLFFNAATSATTTLAGTGVAGFTGDGGLATAATLNAPRAVTVDTSGAVYVADTGNNAVRRISSNGIISTYAGAGNGSCSSATNTRGDGCPATSATFSAPSGITSDSFGGVYVADTGNNVIRTIGTGGYITTFAGGATTGCTADTAYGNGCNGINAVLKGPTGLAFDSTGSSLIVADTGNSMVRSIYLGNTLTTTSATAYTVGTNPVTLIAGTGVAGGVLDGSGTATNTQLNLPTGVAIGPARSVYIADTGNSAVRLVSASGVISTIVGVIGGAGTGTTPGSSANVQLTAPAAVAVNNIGTLQIADAGNNRILTDTRSQTMYNFGRTNIGFTSATQTFIETSIGTQAATLPSPLLTASTSQTQFSLTGSGSTACAAGTLAVGSFCTLAGQFTPAGTGTFTVTYTEVGTNVAAGDPAITLVGTGAVLTRTTSTVAQTAPANNTSQFGGSPVVTATVTAASCNAAATTCYPTGTVRFIVDNTPGTGNALTGVSATSTSSTASQTLTGLSVGTHTVSCIYSGDNFYASSSCGTVTLTVTTAATTSVLVPSNNNMVQFTPVTLTATVTSAAGLPGGTVIFYANGTAIGTSSITAATGVATLTLQRTFCAPASATCVPTSDIYNNGTPISDNTLAPGTYTLTCAYSGASNYSPSNCAAVTFTVLPSVADFSLAARGCAAASLVSSGSSAVPPGRENSCSGLTELFMNGAPLVATAQGSVSDATIFITPANTLAGTLTFSCSGLPQYSVCTFQPTSITLTASSTTALPVYTDMTLFTDIQPNTSSLSSPFNHSNISMAAIIGWPITLLSFIGLIAFRRKGGQRALTSLAVLLMMVGSSLAVTGCGLGGPGAYKAVLTPAGTYPIVVNVTGGGVTHSTTVYWRVSAPGIAGQE